MARAELMCGAGGDVQAGVELYQRAMAAYAQACSMSTSEQGDDLPGGHLAHRPDLQRADRFFARVAYCWRRLMPGRPARPGDQMQAGSSAALGSSGITEGPYWKPYSSTD